MAAITKITKPSYSGSRAAYYGIPPGMEIQKKNIINWKAAERRSTDDNFHHSHWMQESSALNENLTSHGFSVPPKVSLHHIHSQGNIWISLDKRHQNVSQLINWIKSSESDFFAIPTWWNPWLGPFLQQIPLLHDWDVLLEMSYLTPLVACAQCPGIPSLWWRCGVVFTLPDVLLKRLSSEDGQLF